MSGAVPPFDLYAFTSWAGKLQLFSASSEQCNVPTHEHHIIVSGTNHNRYQNQCQKVWSTPWRRLRQCATSLKVAGSIPHYGPCDDSASNRNEYQEYFVGGRGGRCVGLTTLPPSYADCLEICEPQTPRNLRACKGLYKDYFTFTFTTKCRYTNGTSEYDI